MPRKTPKELNEARRARQEERLHAAEEAERRRLEEEQRERDAEAARQAQLAPLRTRLAHLEANEERANQLGSVVDGLYLEMDKLCKKSPADEVTELAMERVNAVIAGCKELMRGDEFIDSIESFVAAGERPEQRDVLLVLGQLRQGLRRFVAERGELRHRSLAEKWEGANSVESDRFEKLLSELQPY